jgi:hypothetical protein
LCGFRYPSIGAIDHCFAFTEMSAYDANCPSEQLMIAGNPIAPTGCCIVESDQCGLNLAGDCLPRSEIHYLTDMSLSTIPCSSP